MSLYQLFQTISQSRKLTITFLLGVCSGLPLLLSASTLTWRLASQGIDNTTIGMFALVGLPYALKFAWAPLVDQGRIPVLHQILGQRLSWIITLQCLMAPAIIILGQMHDNILDLALIALVVSILSASQDIVIDAYRIELFGNKREQGAGASATQLGYRVGMLVSGAGALFLAEPWSWAMVYVAMAVILLSFGVWAISLAWTDLRMIPAHKYSTQSLVKRLHHGIIDPFIDFMRRPCWLWLIVAIIVYRLSDALAGVMAYPFYYVSGFSGAEVASVSKIFGLIATGIGIILGGFLATKYTMVQALIIAGLAQMLSNLFYAILALTGYHMPLFIITIGIENISGGMAGAVFVAFLSSMCRPSLAATQYALLSAFGMLGRTLFASGGGWTVDQIGWFWFFTATTLASLPALLIFLWVDRTNKASSHRMN